MEHRHAFMLFLVILTLVACRSSRTFPVELSPSTSPLQSPVPTASGVVELTVPTPGPVTGIVFGTVVVEDSGEPMPGARVFLGEPIGSDADTPFFGLNPSTAPHATTDEYGRFVITGVAPGDYVVLLWNPVNSIMARDPESGEPFALSVGAEEAVDVGTLSETRP